MAVHAGEPALQQKTLLCTIICRWMEGLHWEYALSTARQT